MLPYHKHVVFGQYFVFWPLAVLRFGVQNVHLSFADVLLWNTCVRAVCICAYFESCKGSSDLKGLFMLISSETGINCKRQHYPRLRKTSPGTSGYRMCRISQRWLADISVITKEQWDSRTIDAIIYLFLSSLFLNSCIKMSIGAQTKRVEINALHRSWNLTIFGGAC